MTKVVLVSGLLIHDSGKTWFATTLAKRLIRNNFRVSMYKPVAAHNAWTQYYTIVRSRELKLLVGSDILTYLDLGLVSINELHITNPIDLLLVPPDIINYLKEGKKYLHNYLKDLTNQFVQVVIARITSCINNTYEHFRIYANLNYVISSLKNEIDNLSTCLGARDIDLKDLVNVLTSQVIEYNLSSCMKLLSDGKDVVVVESFNDAIAPYISLLDMVSSIVLVSHGRALLINDVSSVKDLINKNFVRDGYEALKSLNIIKDLSPSLIFEIQPSLKICEGCEDNFREIVKELMG